MQYSYDAKGNRIQHILVVTVPDERIGSDQSFSPDEVRFKEQIKIFPNPTSEELNIFIDSLQSGVCPYLKTLTCFCSN